jgi:hypothetical protein
LHYPGVEPAFFELLRIPRAREEAALVVDALGLDEPDTRKIPLGEDHVESESFRQVNASA